MFNTKVLFLLTLTIVQIYSQTCFGLDKTAATVCGSAGACVATDLCSCYSGYDGNQCQNKASTTSCTWNKNTLTKTDFYPIADSINYQNDNLLLNIKSPLVEDRLDTKIYIENSTYTQCAYPGTNVVNQLDQTGTCANQFKYTLPWSTGKNCGWSVKDTEDQKIYSGNMYIDQTENIGTIRGQKIERFIKRVIPLQVKFQTRVSISTAIKVFAPVNLFSAVTRQEYIEGPPKAGVFDFITSLQYPFQIDTSGNLGVSESPVGLVPTLKDISDSQQCLPNQPCTQKFTMGLGVTTACSFTGAYKIKLVLKCHPSITNAADCPLDANRAVEIDITANSENFCSVVAVNINLSGTLRAYQEAAHLNRKDAFLLGQTSFFKAEVSSPQATLKESIITRVQWENGNLTKVLYDNNAITAEGTTEKFVMGLNSANTAAFKFDLDAAYMTIPVDGNSDFKVSAVVAVKYQSIDGNSEITYSENAFQLMDLKSISAAEVAPLEGTQDAKYGEQIKIFGTVETTGNSSGVGKTIIWSLNVFLFIFSLYVLSM